jgi:golgi phosphoprotein 3
MASTSGLTRRRGGGAVNNADNEDGSRVSSPAPRRNDDRAPETSYENSENGHKIAFDPRDISESAERNKQPKLTLMEEVILMGLKDKQVGNRGLCNSTSTVLTWLVLGLPVVLE